MQSQKVEKSNLHSHQINTTSFKQETTSTHIPVW